MNTPLLLIAWRRPHTLRQVIESLYSDVNQSCRLGVSRAITWFFEQVEEGIILEDDCLPHPDFFSYCATLLERYRHDPRVWSINGSQFLHPAACAAVSRREGADYWASIHADSWGWAIWRRCWQLSHGCYGRWPAFRESTAFPHALSGRDEQAYWQEVMQQLITLGQPDSWFYGWLLAGWQQGALSLWPCWNLVSHIGSGPGATHCQGLSFYLNLPLQPLPAASLRHPPELQRDRQADRALYLGRRGGAKRRCQHWLGPSHPWWRRISHLLRRVSSSLHSRLHPDLARKVRWRLRHERLLWILTCADKWAVKAWAAQRGVATAPTIVVASREEDLPWQQLPRRCILKASHGWSWNLLHWDVLWYRFRDGDAFASNADGNLDPSKASHCLLTTAQVKAIAATWLASVYSRREWAYTQIPPRLLLEEILQPARAGPLFDICFFMMHGVVRAIGVGSPLFRRHNTMVFIDSHWRALPVRSLTQNWPLQLPPAPVHLRSMLDAVARLGAEFSFARFDFYDTLSGPVLGKVTVSPHAGLINPSEDPTFNRWLAAPWYLSPWARWQAFWV